MPKPLGLRNVCPKCASTSVMPDMNSEGGRCENCNSRVKSFTKLRWSEIKDYRKDVDAKKKYARFSLKSCDETLAVIFVFALVALLVVFVLLGS